MWPTASSICLAGKTVFQPTSTTVRTLTHIQQCVVWSQVVRSLRKRSGPMNAYSEDLRKLVEAFGRGITKTEAVRASGASRSSLKRYVDLAE
jgi:hypothetical protein